MSDKNNTVDTTSTVADLGFVRVGRQPKMRGRQPIIWPKFPQNCLKIKKIGPGERVQNFAM